MCYVVVLTWAVYCLAVNRDVQASAREEVKRVCSPTGDVTADDVDDMTSVSHAVNHTYITVISACNSTQIVYH